MRSKNLHVNKLMKLTTWGQFHQHAAQLLGMHVSKVQKKLLDLTVFIALLGSWRVKGAPKQVGEIDYLDVTIFRSPHQRSASDIVPSVNLF